MATVSANQVKKLCAELDLRKELQHLEDIENEREKRRNVDDDDVNN